MSERPDKFFIELTDEELQLIIAGLRAGTIHKESIKRSMRHLYKDREKDFDASQIEDKIIKMQELNKRLVKESIAYMEIGDLEEGS